MSEHVGIDPGPGTSGIDTGPPAGTPVALGRPSVEHLSYLEARQPPCATCATSPCCTYLLLSDAPVENLVDVDHAAYLLNFEGIVLAWRRDHKVDVYLYQPCGYLDVPSGLCTVHSTPVQPAVCVQYNAHSCAYRHRMTNDPDPDRPFLDPERLAWLTERMVFDDDRRVVEYPDWDEVIDAFRAMPLHRPAASAPGPDPVMEQWRSIALSAKPPDGPVPFRYEDREVSDPCSGCGAWCCQMLVFNRGLPGDASQLEFLRYCLGFPSVEIGVAADSWAVIVRTRCRHLQDGLCSVYGTDERPLKCGYYDALSCGYRSHFGIPRPPDIVRVSRDQFGVVTDSIIFDDLGRIVAMPPIDLLRERLESAERAAVL